MSDDGASHGVQIPKRDSRKPDPDEPWRYVCPDCHGQVTKGKCHRYYCPPCMSSYTHVQLYDKKEQRVVREDTTDSVPGSSGL